MLLTVWQPITNLLKWQIVLYLSLGFAEYLKYTLITASTLLYSVFEYTWEPVQVFQRSRSIDVPALNYLSLFPYVLRFSLSFIFVGSFLLRPLVLRPVSLVWARMVESDKPVFTLIFGGAAAFASAISEAAKHL